MQTSKPATKEKEDAKIEGAVQIAIGVKKEVDFPSWYTNVCLFYNPFHEHGVLMAFIQIGRAHV